MKINWIYFLVITSLLTSCTVAQKTAVPTSTIAATTATAAIIPTSTPTGTPIPKPVGGSGGLMILVNNEIRLVNADGSGEKTVNSDRQRVEICSSPRRLHYHGRWLPASQALLVDTIISSATLRG